MVEEIRNGTLTEVLLEIWRRRKWLLVGASFALLLALLSLIKGLPNLYRASTTVLVGQEEIEEELVTASTRSALPQRLDAIQQALLSRDSLLRLIEDYGLYPDKRELPVEALISRMRRDISLERRIPQEQVFGQRAPAFPLTISYQTWEPELAATVANALAAQYRQENERIRLHQATNTTTFLWEQLEAARLTMAEREEAINDFKTRHLGSLPQQDNINLATLDRLNNELTLNGQRQLQLMNARVDATRQPLDVIAVGASPAMQLDALKKRLAELGRVYTDNYPEMIRLRGQIATLEASMPPGGWPVEGEDGEAGALALDIPSQLDALRREEVQLRARIDELYDKVVYSPAVELELQQLTNSYELARSLFLELQDRYQSARLSESLEMQQEQQFQVLEPAIPPPFPAQPKKAQLAIMSLMLSMGFAAALVFLAEQLDTTFHTPRELRNFTNLPVLGSISRINTTGGRMKGGFRAGLVLLAYALALVVLVVAFNKLGDVMGKTIVWALAGA